MFFRAYSPIRRKRSSIKKRAIIDNIKNWREKNFPENGDKARLVYDTSGSMTNVYVIGSFIFLNYKTLYSLDASRRDSQQR